MDATISQPIRFRFIGLDWIQLFFLKLIPNNTHTAYLQFWLKCKRPDRREYQEATDNRSKEKD